MAKKFKNKILSFSVIYEAVPEGGYVVYVPVLPGCVTEGDTFEEAKKMALDAIRGYLEVLKEDGEDIPIEQEEPIQVKINVPLSVK